MKENQIESEKIIIGNILQNIKSKNSFNFLSSYIFNIIEPDDFVFSQNKAIFVYIKNQLLNKSILNLEKIVNDLSKSQELHNIKIKSYLEECINLYENKDSILKNYIEFIKKQSALNKILPIIKELAVDYKKKELYKSYIFLNSITNDIQRKIDHEISLDFKASNEVIISLVNKLSTDNYITKNLPKKTDDSKKIKTGFNEIDNEIGGFQRGCLSLIGGRPAIGKTILSLTMALNIAKSGTPVGIFSLEENCDLVILRLLSSMTGISTNEIVNLPLLKSNYFKIHTNQANCDQSKIEAINKASDILSNCPIFIYDNYKSFCSIECIEEETKKLKSTFSNLGIIIIDYLGLVESYKPYGEYIRKIQLNDILLKLKHLAINLDITIIVISQLSRAVSYRADNKPFLLDLKELGLDESYIDQVYFLRRVDNYKHKATNIIRSYFYDQAQFEMDFGTNRYKDSEYIDSILELDLVKNNFGKTETFNFNYNKNTNQIYIISNKK